MTETVYAIGDIHGQKAMLDHALALIEADGGPDAQIIFLGDYTDRGPDSRGVIDTLIGGLNAGRNWTCLMGNHDRMFARFVRDGTEHDARVKSGLSWFNPRLGGAATLESYGVTSDTLPLLEKRHDGLEWLVGYPMNVYVQQPDTVHKLAKSAVPESHLTFLEKLPRYYQTDDLIFVHAGLRMELPLEWQDPDDLIWIRDGFLESRINYGKLIVHGHTALDYPQHFGNRVDLDGGAGYGRPLIPAVLEGQDCWLLTDKGRVALRP
ncbi:metallophosphoesterase [Yoonia sp. BS5-3]|uniref:Metallophosphoesterase n=1 Tax=Yoonia phaeophyticola TaxID=3137369 RepID=A0ABZ2VBT8_9RHOB